MEKNKQDLLAQFTRLEWLMHRRFQHARLVCGPMGNPHRGQGRVLALLKMQPEITQKNLTFLLGMRPQSLSELLAKMEQNGYIERTASDEDRRAVNIKLTAKGAEMAEQTDPEIASNDIFDSLTPDEQRTLSEFLDRIIASLENQENAGQEEGFGGFGHGWGHPSGEKRDFGHGFGHDFPFGRGHQGHGADFHKGHDFSRRGGHPWHGHGFGPEGSSPFDERGEQHAYDNQDSFNPEEN